MNAGQICLAPDYAMVPEEQLIALLKKHNPLLEMFPEIKDNLITSVINERHYDRLNDYLEDAPLKERMSLPLIRAMRISTNKHTIASHLRSF